MSLSLLPLFLLLLLFFVFSPIPSLSIRLRQPPILTVRGDGSSPLSVDESEISFTIQSRIESPTPIIQTNEINRTLLSVWLKSVANKTAAISDKVKRYFQTPAIDAKIKKLRTVSLQTTPLTQWKDGLMFYYGAESSHSIAFQTSINASGPIIDDLIRLGVTRIDSVRLVSSDESQRLSRMAALKNATKNAWRKIQASIEPLGWNIGEIEEDKNIIGEDPNKNVNVEIVSMNIEGVTIRPPPQPRELLSSIGFAARMEDSMPMAPPMPSSTVFASDATMTASVVLRVKLTKMNSGGSSNSISNKNTGTESEITAASITSITNSNNNNNINTNNHQSAAKKIHRSSTGLYGTTGVIIMNNNNDNNINDDTIGDVSHYLDDAEVDEMMINNNNNNDNKY